MFDHTSTATAKLSSSVIPLVLPAQEDLPNDFVVNQKSLAKKVFKYYHQRLQESEKIREWLLKRKLLLSDELMGTLCIGYAERNLAPLIYQKTRTKTHQVRGGLEQLGLVRATGFPIFSESLVIPIIDTEGDIVAACGWRLYRAHISLQMHHQCWVGGRATFFNAKALSQFDRVLLTVDIHNGLTLLAAGIPNVVSTIDSYSFGHEHLLELAKYGIKEVILACDNSDQGNHVSGLIAQALSASGIQCSRIPLPRDQSVHQFSLSHEHHQLALQQLIGAKFSYQQTYENM